MDRIIKDVEEVALVLAYADDVAVIADSWSDEMGVWSDVLNRYKIQMNELKQQVMRVDRKKTEVRIVKDGQQFTYVEHF